MHQLVTILQHLLQGGRDCGVGGCSRGEVKLSVVSSVSLGVTLIAWLCACVVQQASEKGAEVAHRCLSGAL